MFLLIYSFDYSDYSDFMDISGEPLWTEEGEKRYTFCDTKEQCIISLMSNIEDYDDEIFRQELEYTESGDYRVGPYLTIHDFFEIKDKIDFDIKETKEYKKFLTKHLEDAKLQEEYREKQQEERELAELKRLKEKYEN